MALNVLSVAGRQLLSEVASCNAALIFDFDGTLAPIVPDPRRAAMRTSTAALLKGVARRYPCAVLSGRARNDIVRRVRGVPIDCIVGNHGLEWGMRPGAQAVERREIRRWRALLEQRLDEKWGAWVEDKGLSLTVHLRGVRDPDNAAMETRRVAMRIGSAVRLVPGAETLNLLPVGTDKGRAVLGIRSLYGCSAALYVGDDETDEDVFGLDEPQWSLVGIRVGIERTAARWRLDTQERIDELLSILLESRSGRRVARRQRR